MSREEIGTLIVVVLKARNLNDKHKFRKQDVLAKISLNGKEEKTKVDIKGGQHPVWDDEIRFPVMKAETGKFRTLEVSCWSKEPRDEDLLGKGTVDISKIIETGEFDDWVPLSIDDVVRGDLYLEMTYYSNGPAPPQAITPPVQVAASARPPVATTPAQVVQGAPNQARPANYAGLGVPQAGGNLMRRPSKFTPAERLARPAYYYQQSPPQSYQGNLHGGSPSPHSQQQIYPSDTRYPAYVPPQGHNGRHSPDKNAALPPLPQENAHGRPHRASAAQAPPPNLLRPGAVSGAPAPRPYSDPSTPTSQARPSQPNPYLTPSQNNRPAGTPAPVQANPYLTSTTPAPAANVYGQQGPVIYQPAAPVSYTPAPHQQPPASYTPAPQQPPPQSYTPAPAHHSQSLPPPSSTPAPSGPPPIWSQAPGEGGPGVGGFSFPVPSITTSAAATPDAGPYPPGAWPGTPSARAATPYDSHYASHRRNSDPREDLAYNPRYQSPLPLPPGARRDPTPQAPTGPPPPPKPRSPSPPPARRPLSPPRRDPSPPKASAMSNERLMALKFMEEEEKRRLEQEKKDLELAMQLDRELNLS